GLLLLRSQQRQPAGQQEPLAFDEGTGDLTDMIAGCPAGAGALERKRSIPPVELVGRNGGIELLQLLVGGGAELPDLPNRVGIAGRRRFELPELGLDAQPRPFVRL